MGRFCSVSGCTNKQRSGMSFHQFPIKDLVLREFCQLQLMLVPKRLLFFFGKIPFLVPKRSAAGTTGTAVTGIHTKPPIMPYFSEFRSVH